MVIGHHLILTGYGHWLPNDPRGSMSSELRAGKLLPFGPMHYGRKRQQPTREELKSFCRQAEPQLDYPLLWFDDRMIRIIAESFRRVIENERYTCWACAILSDHAHLAVRRHRDRQETMIDTLKEESADPLRQLPNIANTHPIWSSRRWHKFLHTSEAVTAVIRYVEKNPIVDTGRVQQYDFVTPYRGEWSGRRW